ncbi:ATP-binding protein [Amycolatopsis sp. lyj-23]|uniref:ATP-binding protein n=1 Tax=Amycolatopsis sp. lyj-23 TaxID=2789283 RepID=UPI0039794538
MEVTWQGTDRAGWRVLELGGAGLSDLTGARRWADALLATLDAPHRVDVPVVVAELLENAHVHAGGPRELRIHRTESPCRVTIAVADTGTGTPRLRVPDAGSGGRGLALVDHVSVSWGWATTTTASSSGPGSSAPNQKPATEAGRRCRRSRGARRPRRLGRRSVRRSGWVRAAVTPGWAKRAVSAMCAAVLWAWVGRSAVALV